MQLLILWHLRAQVCGGSSAIFTILGLNFCLKTCSGNRLNTISKKSGLGEVSPVTLSRDAVSIGA